MRKTLLLAGFAGLAGCERSQDKMEATASERLPEVPRIGLVAEQRSLLELFEVYEVSAHLDFENKVAECLGKIENDFGVFELPANALGEPIDRHFQHIRAVVGLDVWGSPIRVCYADYENLTFQVEQLKAGGLGENHPEILGLEEARQWALAKAGDEFIKMRNEIKESRLREFDGAVAKHRTR